MKRIAGVFFAVSFLLWFSGCGGVGLPTAPTGTLNTTTFALLNGTGSTGLAGTASALSNPTGAAPAESTLISLGATTRRLLEPSLREALEEEDLPRAGACSVSAGITQTPTTPVDADADSIPVTRTRTYECSQNLRQGTVTSSGSFKLEDQDDTLAFPLSGYTFTATDWRTEAHVTAPVDFTFRLTVNGSVSSTVTPNREERGVASIVNAIQITESIEISGASSGSFGIGLNFNSTATPTDPNAPAAGGTMAFTGFLALQGSSLDDFAVSVTSTGLTYINTCGGSNYFNGGSITYAAGSGTATVTYAADCSTTCTLNDSAVACSR